MPRRPRFDVPGAWFHVMNRGIARHRAAGVCVVNVDDGFGAGYLGALINAG